MSYNRRYRNGWQAGVNWTLGLRFEGNTLSPQHLVHNADGTIGLASYQETNDQLLSNVGLRRHLIKGNFVWDFPDIEPSTGAMNVIRAIANDWQVSGVFTAGSGAPYDATFTYQTAGANVNLTGSPTLTELERDKVADLVTRSYVQRLTGMRVAAAVVAGDDPGPEASVGKLLATDTMARTSEVARMLLGPDLTVRSDRWGTWAWSEHVLGAPGYRIAGGTDEIQHNILAERVLGLPREPR